MTQDGPRNGETNLMEITTKQAKPFKNLFDSLKDIIEDAILRWEKDGLYIKASDHSNIIASNTFLLASEFEHYYLSPKINGKDDEPLEINVSVRHLNRAIQAAGNSDIIHMIYNSQEPDYLSIVIKNEEKKETHFSDIQISEVTQDILGVEEHCTRDNYSTILKMPSGEFDSICKNLKRQNVEKVNIHFDGLRLSFMYKVNMNRGRIIRDSVDSNNSSEHLIQRVFHDSEIDDVFCTFSTVYIHNISKCAKIDSKAVVEICLDKETPARFEFRVGTLGSTVFFLAPFIE